VIVYVVRRRHRYTIDQFLAAYARRLPFRLEVLSWERAFRARRLPRATYLLTDLERLAPADQERAARIRSALVEAGARVLNDPLRSLGRYEMLRRLHDAGLNDFDAVRLTEGRWPERWPVFVRDEREHVGALTPLLHSREELAAAVESLVAEGRTRDGRIAVGFGAEADPDGSFRKYGAFRVGDRIVPRHVFWSKDWVVRSAGRVDAAREQEELRYVRESPHERELREIFDRARIDYGRIDYGLVGGRVQTWEINTNAVLAGDDGSGPQRAATNALFVERFVEALAAVDDDVASGTVAIPPPAPWRRRVGEALAEHASGLLRVAGLARFEPRLRAAAYRRIWRHREARARRERTRRPR
jgi:hypothetical protein